MKKIISLILVLCTMLSVCTVMTSADTTCSAAGDANTDGKINLTDASVILKHIAKWSNINIVV